MPITATLELKFKPESVDAARDIFSRELKATRAFDGCLGVEVLVDAANPARWLLIEKWESEEHDAAYRTFRAGPGAITDLGPLLAGAPVLTKYTVDDSV